MSEVDAKVDVAEQQPAKMDDSADLKAIEPSADVAMKDEVEAEAAKDVEVKDQDEKKPTEAEDKPPIKKTKAVEHDDRQKNIKFDASTLPKSDDPHLIRRQVEFYFSDSNLLFDNHMKEQIQSEKNLPIKISHIHSFKRMKRFQPYSAVVAALKDCAVLEVAGEEGEETVQRKVPFDLEKATQDKDRIDRSVYVKGFGDEDASSQFDLEAFFVKFGSFNQVRLRRTDKGLFKGSVFVEYDSVETAKKFLEMDPKPVYKDCPALIIMSRAEYESEKQKQIRDGNKDPSQTRYNNNRNNHSKRGRGGYSGDKDDWNKRRDHDRKNGFRGGRGGRGRGGRGRGGRDDRRDNRASNGDRNGDQAPAAQDAASDNVKKDSAPEESKKRAREDDDVKSEAPAKKEKLSEETKAE